MGVVEIGNGNQPVVDPDVRNNPEESNSLPVEHLGGLVKSEARDGETNVGDDDEVSLLGKEKDAPGIEVAATLGEPAPLVVVPDTALVASGDVEKEVSLPAEELVEEQFEGGDDRGVLGHLLEGLDGNAKLAGDLLNSTRDEHEILLDVAGEAVVTGVRDFPRKIRDAKERVTEPADDIVQTGMSGESAVAALVGENPQASENAALGETIENPKRSSDGKRLETVDLQGTVAESGHHGDVTRQVGHGDCDLGLEAMGRNGALQVTQTWAILRVPGRRLKGEGLRMRLASLWAQQMD